MYSEDPDQSYEQRYNDSAFEANPPHLDGVPEMSALIHLEAPNVLHNLECRYKQGEIYTSISKVLIAINPYRSLDLYGPEVIQRYQQAASDMKRRLKSDLPPHVFTVAQTSYFNLVKLKMNQSMIVCGESGSGKTESAKHLMRYLAANSKSEERGMNSNSKVEIENQVLDANPILESFGNAKTVLNNNSSRFGKFTKLVFQSDMIKIAGSFIETYLLEKSRVTKQDLGERNYHIFYMLCRANNLISFAHEFCLSEPENFFYLNQSGTSTAEGINDEEKVGELLSALKTLSFSEQEQKDLLCATAAVLHVGNIKLVPDQKDYAIPNKESAKTIEIIVKLLKLDVNKLIERLTTKKIKVARETISSRLSLAEGGTNREALSKAIYQGIFLWLVKKINEELYRAESRDDSLNWIGILDVFGFESFLHNSFEQFCINFANERLQQYFNGYILLSEQDEYIAEAIKWTPLRVANNQDVIDLIDRGKNSILGVLDSECMVGTSTKETFIQNLFKIFPANKRLAQIRRKKTPGVSGYVNMHGFSIVHYAGKVIYTVDDFLVKNNDAPSAENVNLLAGSESKLVQGLLVSTDAPAEGTRGGGLKSTGKFFSKQLEILMNNLQATTPFFVRCIKPNPLKKPYIFDWKYVRPQLECGGIIEALRILKCGYPTRCTYESIFDRYGHILHPTPPKLNKRDFCEAVLRCCGTGLDRTEFQLGLTKCFFRPGKQEFLEELLQGPELKPEVVVEIKRFLLNKRFQRARGVITSGICFSFILRRMRAQAHVKRLFEISGVLNVMRDILTNQRQQISAVKLQASARALLQNKLISDRKCSIRIVVDFYHHNLIRRTLQTEIDKKIKAQIALLSAKQQQEKAEVRRKELQGREQTRLDALRAKEEAEKAKIKADAEKVQQAQETKENGMRAKEENLATRLTQLEEEQVTVEQLEPGRDALAQLLEEGQVFEVKDSARRISNSTPSSRKSSLSLGVTKVFLQVNLSGELSWTNAEADRNEQGRISLLKVTKVVGMKSSPHMFVYADTIDGCLCLELQAPDSTVRSKWCTALLYAKRNFAESGIISRPVTDQARGNWKCAELFDQLAEQRGLSAALEQENADLRVQHKVMEAELESTKEKLVVLEEAWLKKESNSAVVIHPQEILVKQENESKMGFQRAQDAMRDAQRMMDECDNQIQNTNAMLERLGISNETIPDLADLDETTRKLLEFRSEQKAQRDSIRSSFEARVAAMVVEAERLNDINDTSQRRVSGDQTEPSTPAGKKKKNKDGKDDGCAIS